jgi:hypothetical protein
MRYLKRDKVSWTTLDNPDTNELELCTIHEEKGMSTYIFYDINGKFLDFKIEIIK